MYVWFGIICARRNHGFFLEWTQVLLLFMEVEIVFKVPSGQFPTLLNLLISPGDFTLRTLEVFDNQSRILSNFLSNFFQWRRKSSDLLQSLLLAFFSENAMIIFHIVSERFWKKQMLHILCIECFMNNCQSRFCFFVWMVKGSDW